MGRTTRIIALTLLAIALGVATIFCVLKVGDLNGQAAVLEAMNNAPASQGKAANLRNTANTMGMLGWAAFILLIFSVGSTLMDNLRD